jgi:cytochrome c oxidase cbb3-type subunit 3
MIRPVTTTIVCVAVAIAANLSAQPPAGEFDPAAVERGQQLLSTQCGFCHGANARGGSSGPDLTRSALVQTDEGGTQLGQFLRVGRPDRGMPAFDFTDAQMADLAVFLHSANRPPEPAHLDRNAIKATVTIAGGESITGAVVRLTDFDVAIYDPASGQTRTWLRSGDAPRVVVTDPLQAHVDQLAKWTDADMHNVTAYLAGLK